MSVDKVVANNMHRGSASRRQRLLFFSWLLCCEGHNVSRVVEEGPDV